MDARILRTAGSYSPPGSRMSGYGGRLVTRMQLQVTRWDAKRHGPVTRAKVLARLKEEGFSTTVYTFPPGTHFGNHTHPVEKKDSILSGQFLFKMDNEEVVLQAGDMLLVPRGRVHSAEVIGSEACEFVDASRQS